MLEAIKPFPDIINRVISAAEKAHAAKVTGQLVRLPARYTPFPSLQPPRYTRYFSDGRASNLEVEVDSRIHTLRVYGANVHEYLSMAEVEEDCPGISDIEAENWKLFEQIGQDPNKFLRAYTLTELERKYAFFVKMQGAHIKETGKPLTNLPFPVHCQPLDVDLSAYRQSFFAEGRQLGSHSDSELESLFQKNMSRKPYLMAVVFEGVSMRIRDLQLLSDDEDNPLQKKFEPFLLSLYGHEILDESALRDIVKRFCNSLIYTMNFIHANGQCIWRKQLGNDNMGIKDVSITGNIFDPEPIAFSPAEAAGDKFQILFSMLSFIWSFQYKFPRDLLVDIAREMAENIGLSPHNISFDIDLMPPFPEKLIAVNMTTWS